MFVPLVVGFNTSTLYNQANEFKTTVTEDQVSNIL